MPDALASIATPGATSATSALHDILASTSRKPTLLSSGRSKYPVCTPSCWRGCQPAGRSLGRSALSPPLRTEQSKAEKRYPTHSQLHNPTPRPSPLVDYHSQLGSHY